MKKFIPFIASAVVIAGLYYYLYQTPASTQSPDANNNLVVGISPDFPPFALIDLESGQIVGLEVDVVTEIAKRMNKNLIIKDMPFNSLIIELIAGQIDAIAAGMTPTPERKKNILFSVPYIEDDENIAVFKKDAQPITCLQDLFEKQVAVNIGYTSDTYLSKYPEVSLIRLKTPSDGFMALQSGSVDVFVIAQSIFDNFAQSHSAAEQYQTFTLPASADACALAFAKYNKKLQAQIDPIITGMIEDGTMLAIKKKWGFA